MTLGNWVITAADARAWHLGSLGLKRPLDTSVTDQAAVLPHHTRR